MQFLLALALVLLPVGFAQSFSEVCTPLLLPNLLCSQTQVALYLSGNIDEQNCNPLTRLPACTGGFTGPNGTRTEPCCPGLTMSDITFYELACLACNSYNPNFALTYKAR